MAVNSDYIDLMELVFNPKTAEELSLGDLLDELRNLGYISFEAVDDMFATADTSLSNTENIKKYISSGGTYAQGFSNYLKAKASHAAQVGAKSNKTLNEIYDMTKDISEQLAKGAIKFLDYKAWMQDTLRPKLLEATKFFLSKDKRTIENVKGYELFTKYVEHMNLGEVEEALPLIAQIVSTHVEDIRSVYTNTPAFTMARSLFTEKAHNIPHNAVNFGNLASAKTFDDIDNFVYHATGGGLSETEWEILSSYKGDSSKITDFVKSIVADEIPAARAYRIENITAFNFFEKIVLSKTRNPADLIKDVSKAAEITAAKPNAFWSAILDETAGKKHDTGRQEVSLGTSEEMAAAAPISEEKELLTDGINYAPTGDAEHDIVDIINDVLRSDADADYIRESNDLDFWSPVVQNLRRLDEDFNEKLTELSMVPDIREQSTAREELLSYAASSARAILNRSLDDRQDVVSDITNLLLARWERKLYGRN